MLERFLLSKTRISPPHILRETPAKTRESAEQNHKKLRLFYFPPTTSWEISGKCRIYGGNAEKWRNERLYCAPFFGIIIKAFFRLPITLLCRAGTSPRRPRSGIEQARTSLYAVGRSCPRDAGDAVPGGNVATGARRARHPYHPFYYIISDDNAAYRLL